MESWKVAIALSMTSNHAAVLGALSSHLLGVNHQVNQLHGNFGRLQKVIAGALSVTAGIALFGVMEKLVEKTKDYSDELVKLERLGGSMTQAVLNGDVGRKAFDISQRVPMKVTDLMKIPGAAYSIMGEEEAMKFWEPMAKFSFVMQSQRDYKGDPGKDLQNVIRAGELSGRITDPVTKQIDPERLQRWLDLSAKIMAATHNMVNPATLLGMAQQGGFAIRGLTDEGFMTQAIVAQAMGGQRSGTALMSLWQQMAGGTMFTRTAEGMEALGLLKHGEWRKDHGRVILGDEASQRLTKLIGSDPLDFIHNITENLKKRGITDPQEQARMVQRALNRATTQRYTIEQVMNLQQIEAERSRMRQGYGNEGSFGAIMNKSVGANLEALKSAWDNLLMAVAGPNSQNVISLLQSLTSAINAVTKSVNETNPQTLRDLGIGIGVLAVALTVGGGAVLLGALGAGGWLIVGLTALAGAAALLAPKIKDLAALAWEKIAAGFDAVKNAISSFIDWLASIPGKIGGFLGGLLGIDKGGSTTSPGKTGAPALKKNTMFEPGQRGGRATPISLSLNVDGQTLAQVISDKIAALSGYETSTPAADGSMAYGV